MFGVVAVILLLVSKAESNWDVKDNNQLEAGMEFVYVNMTCNDAGTVCQLCFPLDLFGEEFLVVAEYTTTPYRFEVDVKEGKQDRIWYFSQDDPEERYRWCETAHSQGRQWYFHKEWRYTVCFENSFSGISLPVGCGKPLTMFTHDSHYYDEQLRGQQMLLCLP